MDIKDFPKNLVLIQVSGFQYLANQFDDGFDMVMKLRSTGGDFYESDLVDYVKSWNSNNLTSISFKKNMNAIVSPLGKDDLRCIKLLTSYMEQAKAEVVSFMENEMFVKLVNRSDNDD